MTRVKVDFDDQKLRVRIRSFDRDLQRQISAVVDYEAAYATGYLKTHAPWTDRTGAARAGLLAVPHHHGKAEHDIIMSYSVYYGIWLEVANSGKYAVIGPALFVIGQKLMADLSHLVDVGRI